MLQMSHCDSSNSLRSQCCRIVIYRTAKTLPWTPPPWTRDIRALCRDGNIEAGCNVVVVVVIVRAVVCCRSTERCWTCCGCIYNSEHSASEVPAIVQSVSIASSTPRNIYPPSNPKKKQPQQVSSECSPTPPTHTRAGNHLP